MSVLDEKREELEHYEFRMGVPRGRLAVALDTLTDALTMVGQHGVYCQSARQTRQARHGHSDRDEGDYRRQRVDRVGHGRDKEAERRGWFTTEALRHREVEIKL